MTDRDMNRGDGPQAGSTYASITDQPGRSDGQGSSNAGAHADGDLRQKAKEDLASVRNMAQEEFSNVSARAGEMAEEQKGFAAEKMAGIAAAIKKAGDELENQEQPDVGRMTRQMGETVERFAEDIKGRNMSEIAGMAEDFGRRQPLAFLGMAAIAGLAASRFIGASASRQSSMKPRTTGTPGSDLGTSSTTPRATGTASASGTRTAASTAGTTPNQGGING
ncbi:nutrient deprivation-induced protein [Rhizobium sp. SAFR-030]|uniref:nutrient deprivation-induced protein n=1 Tax=Rhizobium sp. SAFR-030 TaxID=3387277 RepID=UPI003F80E769